MDTAESASIAAPLLDDAPAVEPVSIAAPRTDVPAAVTPSIVGPAVVYAALFASIGAYFPYIPLYYADLGLGLPVVGALSALNAAVALVAAPAWGAFVDRRGRSRRAIVVASIWSAAAATLLGVVAAPPLVAVGVVLLAAASSAIAPLLDTRTVELLGSDRDRYGRARAWGSAAFLVATLATAPLLTVTGSRGMFLVFVPLLLLTALASARLLGGAQRGPVRTMPSTPWSGLVGILRLPTLGPLFVASVVFWTSVAGVIAYTSIRLVDLAGDASLVGLLWGLGSLVEIPLMLLFPALVRRTGPGAVVAAGALAYAVRAAAWSFVADPVTMLVIAPLGGVGFAFVYVGTVSYVARAVPPGAQATAQGLFSGTTFSLGSIAGSIGAGAIVAAGLAIPELFAICAALSFAAAGWIAWIVRGGRHELSAGRTAAA